MISLVVAMDQNRVIGHENKLPWHLPADLKYFRKITMGHTVIMGRKTFESIGKPLPGRKNIILTTNRDFLAEGCQVIHSIEEIEDDVDDEVFVIGGAELFRQVLAVVHKLYVTEIAESFAGDTYFPMIDSSQWQVTSRTAGTVDEANRYPHEFLVYTRR